MNLLWMVSGLALVAAGCDTPAREPVVNTCTGNQHCPANGKWYCDLLKKECVPCAGSCPVSRIKDPDVPDTASDDAESTDAAAADGVVAADTSAAAADTSAAAVDAGTPDTGPAVVNGSCANKCFDFKAVVYKDGVQKECSCFPSCILGIPGVPKCCADYEVLCGSTDPSNVSCTGRCGVRDVSKDCQCDTACDDADKDDCCEDHGSVCGTCPNAKCEYDSLAICQCDANCVKLHDCCSDYEVDQCPAK